jgi:hypothetical protein
MKNKMNLVGMILAMLIFGNLVFAQNNEDAEKEVEGKMPIADAKMRRIPNTEPMIVSDEKMAEMSKTQCTLGLNQTITAGINDNLAPANDPTFKSPALSSLFPTTKVFDDQTVNKIFAHSFSLKNYKPCESKLCRASLVVRVCNSGKDLWTNDKIYVGSANAGVFTSSFYAGTIWNSNGSESKQCKNLNFPLNTSLLNGMNFLDVVMQDDSTIDYMQLFLNY